MMDVAMMTPPVFGVIAVRPHSGWRAKPESRSRKSAQDDKWSFCLTAGTLCPTNQEKQ